MNSKQIEILFAMKQLILRSVLAAFIILLSQAAALSQENGHLDLNGTWKVTWTDGVHGREILTILEFSAEKDLDRYMDVPVPMDLNKAMEAIGLIDDPNISTNSLKARWIGQQYWCYYRTFDVDPTMLEKRNWLVFDRLDYAARIYLNGKKIGSHQNAYTPCRIDVSGLLLPGKNTLTVGIESGHYLSADKNGGNYIHPNRIESSTKRSWLRKPQYQYGWDWNPLMVNVGITGDVYLEWAEKARIDQTLIQAELSDDLNRADLKVNTYIQGCAEEVNATIRVTVVETRQRSEQAVMLGPDVQRYSSILSIKKPELWWPTGQGPQHFYHIKTDVIVGGTIADSKTSRIGIRNVEIDQSPHPVEGKYFTLKVNNRNIFCKGGNWVPADMIYSAVTKEKLSTLVALAKEANFNMLRIWGGGEYAGHDLLDLCDQEGILVWHDFLFACDKYPGNDPEFLENVKEEITWAAREYSSHPSMAVWCGNNEILWGWESWGYKDWGLVDTDLKIYLEEIPKILEKEEVAIPYWPGSPYSETPGTEANSPIEGDQHPWSVSLGEFDADFYAYRNFTDRFPNEGGVLGATGMATLKQFMPGEELQMRSFTWDHHDNTVNYWSKDLGISYRSIEFWLGKDYNSYALEDFVFASSLLHSEGLHAYITNYRRRMYSSSSAIFWMYNDSWPVTNGWTIVDYYERRKLAFYAVKRAFQPVSVVIVEDADSFTIYGINDSPADWSGELKYGVFETSGEGVDTSGKKVRIKQNASDIIASIDKNSIAGEQLKSAGVYAILLNKDGSSYAQDRYFNKRFKALDWYAPKIEIYRRGEHVVFKSPVFVWGTCIDLDGELHLPDNCFDLIPGMEYTIPWPEDRALPEVVKTGNDLMR
ncbi:sugar-binding domain-containing protein [Bacteroidota bacterium]